MTVASYSAVGANPSPAANTCMCSYVPRAKIIFLSNTVRSPTSPPPSDTEPLSASSTPKQGQAVVYSVYARLHFRWNMPFCRWKIPFCTCIPQLWGVLFLSLTKFTPCGKFITFGNDTIDHTNFFETLVRRHLVCIQKWQHGESCDTRHSLYSRASL